LCLLILSVLVYMHSPRIWASVSVPFLHFRHLFVVSLFGSWPGRWSCRCAFGVPLENGMVLIVLDHIASSCYSYHLQMNARFSLLREAGSKFLVLLPFSFSYVLLFVWLLVAAMEALDLAMCSNLFS
jgi:hypothetical protein